MSRESFIARVEREMPAGTVISNPKWWAERLWKWSQQSWIPYKEGDVVKEGNYWITVRYYSSDCGTWTETHITYVPGSGRLPPGTIAYLPLPTPYVSEVSDQ